MKCPTCNKDYAAGVKAAYKLGLQDGKNQYVQRLNCLEKTNRQLFEQLRVMDMREPDHVNRVYLSREYLEGLCNLLRKKQYHKKAREIKKIIEDQLGETYSNEAKLRQALAELME